MLRSSGESPFRPHVAKILISVAVVGAGVMVAAVLLLRWELARGDRAAAAHTSALITAERFELLVERHARGVREFLRTQDEEVLPDGGEFAQLAKASIDGIERNTREPGRTTMLAELDTRQADYTSATDRAIRAAQASGGADAEAVWRAEVEPRLASLTALVDRVIAAEARRLAEVLATRASVSTRLLTIIVLSSVFSFVAIFWTLALLIRAAESVARRAPLRAQ